MIDRALELLGSVEEFITELSQNPWFLLFLFVVAFLDSVFPIVPSEFSVIAGGVASGSGLLIDDQQVLSIVLVIVLAAIGAYGGDSLAYAIGSRSDKLLRKIFFRGDKGDKRLFATGEQIRKRGGLLLITARFVPGGRTAMTFSCGLTGQPFWGWFSRWDLLATTLWATYAGLLGFFFGTAVEDPTNALWIAFGFALSVTVLIEAGRWIIDRRRDSKKPVLPDTEEVEAL